MRRVVVVGGVAGGMSASTRLRRLDESAEIVVLERSGYVSFANCGLPYHVGGVIEERSALLLQTPESLAARFRLDVRVGTEAVAVDPAAKTVTARTLATGDEHLLSYDKLMLAPGASPLRPAIPGISDKRILSLRSLQDMDRIVAASETGMRAVVVGAGFIGLEMSEQLQRKGLSVHLVELQQQVFPQLDASMAALLESELKRNHISLTLGDAIARFESDPNIVRCHLHSGKVIDADMVILSIGVAPDTSLAAEAELMCALRRLP